MKTLLNCVGLDYHEDTIRVCVMTPNGKTLWNRDVPNHARVVRDRVLLFSPPSVVAIEACCGAANFAEELRRLTNWNVKLAKRKQLKQHLVQRGKSGSVATAAVANRWLRWLYHQLVTKSADQAA